MTNNRAWLEVFKMHDKNNKWNPHLIGRVKHSKNDKYIYTDGYTAVVTAEEYGVKIEQEQIKNLEEMFTTASHKPTQTFIINYSILKKQITEARRYKARPRKTRITISLNDAKNNKIFFDAVFIYKILKALKTKELHCNPEKPFEPCYICNDKGEESLIMPVKMGPELRADIEL